MALMSRRATAVADVAGIGDKTAARLVEAGYASVDDVLNASIAALVQVPSVGARSDGEDQGGGGPSSWPGPSRRIARPGRTPGRTTASKATPADPPPGRNGPRSWLMERKTMGVVRVSQLAREFGTTKRT